MHFLFRLALLALVLSTYVHSKCMNPPPAARYTLQGYKGTWYEIAKYQTAGGAFFEKDCRCTEIKVGQSSGKVYAEQTCLKNGKITGVNATLLPTEYPGKYIEQISLNKVGYWVIQLDETTAIEYDCQDSLGITNYCIHIMSRSKQLSEQRLSQLSDYALSLGLNANNLKMTRTDQVNCPSSYLRAQ